MDPDLRLRKIFLSVLRKELGAGDWADSRVGLSKEHHSGRRDAEGQPTLQLRPGMPFAEEGLQEERSWSEQPLLGA